jgi:diguanylate cyclase (GGDEF)-like protein/PAS domain S-box-containing protein
MSKAGSFSLRSKTNMAFSMALLALATIVFFSIRESRGLAEKDRRISQTRDVMELSQQVIVHLAEAAAARTNYIRSPDDAQFTDFNRASALLIENYAALRRLVYDQNQLGRLTRMESLLRGRLALLKDAMDSHKRNSQDRLEQDSVNTQSSILMAEFLDLLHEFDRVEQNLLQRASNEAETGGRHATQINVVLSIFVLTFLILTLSFLNRELSRREKAELSAAEQKDLLQSILNSCSDSVTVADRSGEIILRNPTSLRDIGNARIGRLDGDYPRLVGLYKGDSDTLYKTEELPLSRALRGESATGLEMYVRPPDGAEPKWMLAAGGPLFSEAGERMGGVVFLRDITDRKKTDKRLSAALRDAERHAKEDLELRELGDLLQSCRSFQEAYELCESILSHIFHPCPGALCLINASRDLVEVVASWKECKTTELVFSTDDCWALRRGKLYGDKESAVPLRCAHVHKSATGPYLCVPLIPQGETMGVLYIEDNSVQQGIVAEERQGLQATLHRRAIAVADRVSLALANLRLRELLRNQSIRDPLTGLFNRRYMEESLNREIQRASRSGRYASLVMLDLDHFKHFNDTFGHQAGDVLLKEVAATIKTRVRAGDLACRYGGEEFSIIIAEADAEGAHKCVESIRDAIKHLSVHHRGQTLGAITVSAGIASFPAHGNNPEDLTHAADKALYQAKKEGRDRIVIYDGIATAAISGEESD